VEALREKKDEIDRFLGIGAHAQQHVDLGRGFCFGPPRIVNSVVDPVTNKSESDESSSEESASDDESASDAIQDDGEEEEDLSVFTFPG
jgi:hypothetical protein